MVAVRLVIVACVLGCAACGRLGFGGDAAGVDSTDVDPHLHAAGGWSIAPLVDLSGVIAYRSDDFIDADEIRDNGLIYVAALYPPFDDILAVLAGRSVIAIAANGAAHEHNYRPVMANGDGPDGPGRAAFLDLGTGKVGLWITSATREAGDGLYLVASDWSITRPDRTNNTYALGADPTGSYDGAAGPALYVASGSKALTSLRRWTPTRGPEPVAQSMTSKLVGDLAEVAAMGGSLFITVDEATRVALDRVGSSTSPAIELASATTLALAEGSTARGLFAVRDGSALVSIDPESGAFTVDAWTDDPDRVWRAVCAPRDTHPLAGQLVVLESNRDHSRDRLLLITPP